MNPFVKDTATCVITTAKNSTSPARNKTMNGTDQCHTRSLKDRLQILFGIGQDYNRTSDMRTYYIPYESE